MASLAETFGANTVFEFIVKNTVFYNTVFELFTHLKQLLRLFRKRTEASKILRLQS
jgi:hypothetical protein